MKNVRRIVQKERIRDGDWRRLEGLGRCSGRSD